MKQQQFEAQNAALWAQIEDILRQGAKSKDTKSAATALPSAGASSYGASSSGLQDAQSANAYPSLEAQRRALPQLYRRLCQTLALALQRGYSPTLCAHLQLAVQQTHQLMYGAVVARPLTLWHWVLVEFPRRVRQEWPLLLLAMLAFWGVALGLGLLVWFQPHWAYSFLDPQMLGRVHSMYADVSPRGSNDDVLMFGFYIWNNVSIGFRTFAGGIAGGIWALFSLAFNGVNLGVIGAWLSHDAATREHFWSFVITHSSFEITGLILFGQAGMRLGLALLRPGRMTRRHALEYAGQQMFPVVLGATFLTLLAAFVEGFWSASPAIEPSVKYVVGGICWVSVLLFFSLAGRGSR